MADEADLDQLLSSSGGANSKRHNRQRRLVHPFLADMLVIGEDLKSSAEYFKGTLQDFRVNDLFVLMSNDTVVGDGGDDGVGDNGWWRRRETTFGTKTSERNVLPVMLFLVHFGMEALHFVDKKLTLIFKFLLSFLYLPLRSKWLAFFVFFC